MEFSIVIERRDLETGEVFSSDRFNPRSWTSPEEYLRAMRKRRKGDEFTHFADGYTQTSHCGTYETQYTVAPPTRHNRGDEHDF